MAFPRVPDREMAVVFKMHVGLTRDNKVVLDSDTVENVLGDIPHRRCVEVIAAMAQEFMQKILDHHFGDSADMSSDEVKQYLDSLVPDDLSFFDREVDISDE